MATVTRKFRDDFETWAQHRIDTCEWTLDEIESLREMLRTDLKPGPDQFRQGVVVLCKGIEMPAAIDDHEDRYRLWADFFDVEAKLIRSRVMARGTA